MGMVEEGVEEGSIVRAGEAIATLKKQLSING
jgi:hypothetical protein